MHKKFDHAQFEKKWQESWRSSGIYNVGKRDLTKEKEYVLVEWPYPSGNLHVGHWHAFAVPDIYVRQRRMAGKQVLFPMGFDAFGLPAENAAIKHKLDPKTWTDRNIAHMRSQLESMGNAFSWDVTTSSTDASYFKWTQWMFTQFFEKGIAYRGSGVVNWCPGCNTVIANEQVLSDGTCERSGHLIEKREMPQWMLRITQYADALIDDLDGLAWPEYIKESQRQWIGRKRGAEIPFTLSTGEHISVFTTRPDTIFGVSYVVVAPEHPLLSELGEHITNLSEVETYVYAALQKDEMDRTNATQEKSGVVLEGITALNPATGTQVPVYVAEYVLGNYGTGAVMGVPAHDERDYTFARTHNLSITQVIEGAQEVPFSKKGTLIHSGEFTGMDSIEASECIIKKCGGRATSTYRLRDWSIGRQRYWGVPIPIVYDPEGTAHSIPEEHLPWHLPIDVDFTPTGEPPLAKSVELKERVERIFGKGWTPEVETMDTFVDSSWYFLRYLDVHNTTSLSALVAQKEWMPVDTYFGGSEHTTMHLLYSRFWQKALYELGLVTTREPYAHRVNRGLILASDGSKMSKSKGNTVDPDEQVTLLGADTVKMYLAFMGPYGEPSNYPWDTHGIAGIRRFLERVYGLNEHIVEKETDETTRLLHKTIQKVTRDIGHYKFNTAISALMVFINHVERSGLTQATYKTFLTLLAPFAPHLTEELWSLSGETSSIHLRQWPTADTILTQEAEVTLSVQISGKMRGTVTVPADADEKTALEAVYADVALKERITGTPRRIIFVKNKVINIVLAAGE